MSARPKWNWAHYSRRQQLALWSLLLLIFLFFSLSHLLRWSPREISIDEELIAAAALLLQADSEEDDNQSTFADRTDSRSHTRSTTNPPPASFPFNPNTVSQAELVQLGLKEYQARAWVRYRESGAEFRQASDIGRLRVLKAEDVERLLPLVNLPAAIVATTSPRENPMSDQTTAAITEVATVQADDMDEEETVTPSTYERTVTLSAYTDDFTIDINQASAAEWEQLRGIGPYWAGRIIKFRDALGGFTSTDQIGETYGFPDSTFQAIKEQLMVSELYRLLPINRASVEELKAHPYINSRLANILVNYREQHGPYQSGDDLANIRILTDVGRARLLPYLEF